MTAAELIAKMGSKAAAIACCEVMIQDLQQSMEICKTENLHPHAQGLIEGSISHWVSIKKDMEIQS